LQLQLWQLVRQVREMIYQHRRGRHNKGVQTTLWRIDGRSMTRVQWCCYHLFCKNTTWSLCSQVRVFDCISQQEGKSWKIRSIDKDFDISSTLWHF
jgi:hypothetical protein